MTSINAMRLALEALQCAVPKNAEQFRGQGGAITALREAIQQAEAQQTDQSVNEEHFGDFELLVVTTAYEQGFGHAFRTELSNPYAPATNAYKAWDMGRSAGKRNGQPQQPATGEPVAWLDEMLADTREVFDAGGSETPQVVRDVIEYVASWVTVYSEKNRPAPSVPKDDQIAALVNKVRDIARMFHDHQSLRERIAIELVPALKAKKEAP